MTTSDPLVICTAWNSAYAKIGEICSESIVQHIRRVEAKGGTGITFVSRLIPEEFPRPSSWFKVGLLQELLAVHPHVLWIDCDALLIDQKDVRQALDFAFPLGITADINGPNGGVMLWSQCEESQVKLAQVNDLYERFKDGPWWEQHAIQHLMQQTPKGEEWWSVMPKEVMNAYSSELQPTTRVIHFPGFSFDEKIKLMEAQAIAIRRNGHGHP